MTIDTKSYLMGVFDGEGSISAYFGKRDRCALTISVTMASEPIVDLFVRTWGGGKHRVKKLTIGGLQLFTWHISASRSIPFLEFATSHSHVKRRQAEIGLALALEMRKYTKGGGYRKGVALNLGERLLSDAEIERRKELVLVMRSLNGARSRFGAAA